MGRRMKYVRDIIYNSGSSSHHLNSMEIDADENSSTVINGCIFTYALTFYNLSSSLLPAYKY